MFLSLTLAALAQYQAGPLPTAPYGLPNSQAFSSSHSQSGMASLETFESYVLPTSGGAENIGTVYLDDSTITGTGQGPGLVLSGAFYSCAGGSLQWNDDTYFGLPTKTFLANSGDGTLAIGYASPQSSISMSLHAFSGFGDTAVVTAYDASGAVVDTTGPVGVPGPTGVPVTLSGAGILRVLITGVHSWSPIIDNHDFAAGGGTLQLSILGPCPGVNSVTINGGTPGAACQIGYAFGTGSFVIPAGPCAGTVTGLDASATALPTTYFFDAAGQINFNQFIPAAACGAVFVQALEIGTCNLSNVVSL